MNNKTDWTYLVRNFYDRKFRDALVERGLIIKKDNKFFDTNGEEIKWQFND